MKFRLSLHKAKSGRIEDAIAELRKTPVPGPPADLIDRLVPPQPSQTPSRIAFVPAVAAVALLAAVAVIELGKPARQGHSSLALHGPSWVAPSKKSTRVDGWGTAGTKPLEARSGIKSNRFVRPVVRALAVKQADDLAYLNIENDDQAPNFAGIASYRLAKLPPMKDDFVEPPPMLYASISHEPPSPEDLARFQQEANIVDERLFKNVSFAVKHASMTEMCAELARQTGVPISAGRNVKDENVTLFVKPRPAREVMREIGRVFGFTWEREEDEGKFSYRLKQDTASEIAEENLRNQDVQAAIQTITHMVRTEPKPIGRADGVIEQIFCDLLPDELQRLQSGQKMTMTTSGSDLSPDQIEPELSKKLLASMGGIKPIKDSYIGDGNLSDTAVIPFTSMADAGANLGFRLKITEFGGASLGADIDVHGSTDHYKNAGFGTHAEIGAVGGVAEAPVENAKLNVTFVNAPGMGKVITLRIRATIPVEKQTVKPADPQIHTIANSVASYEFIKELQPPRPYMSADDYWQAVHEATGQDVIADSFSRLFRLEEYTGSEFDVLSKGSDDLHYKWSLDSGFVVGRSRGYYWQRTNEVPKSTLERWVKSRKASGSLPLEGVVEMSTMTDRQLDAIEVGKTIINQWMLPEWNVPSRPMWKLAGEPVRPICRALAAMGPEEMNALANGMIPIASLTRDQVEQMGVKNQPPDTLIGVHYVPPGKYFWNPLFEMNKEPVHTDLITGNTEADVDNEAARRFPEDPRGQVTQSSGGSLCLVVVTKSYTYCIGDFFFGQGHRGPFE